MEGQDGVHGALLYSSPAEFAAAAGQFASAGAAAGEAVLIAASGANLDSVRQQLDGHTDLVTLTDLAETGANPLKVLGMIREFAASHRGQPVRCVQQLAWYPRRPAELLEAARTDELLGLSQAVAPASVLCGYDTRLGPAILASAERTHPWLVSGGGWQQSRAYAPERRASPPLSAPPPEAAALTYRDNQSAVRRFTAEHARAAGLSLDRVTDVVIAVAELAANTLCYASGTGTVAAWRTGEEFCCDVHDGGEIGDPLAGTLRPAPDSERRGRGLWVVNQLCDLVEVRSGPDGTTIRVHMRLPG